MAMQDPPRRAVEPSSDRVVIRISTTRSSFMQASTPIYSSRFQPGWSDTDKEEWKAASSRYHRFYDYCFCASTRQPQRLYKPGKRVRAMVPFRQDRRCYDTVNCGVCTMDETFFICDITRPRQIPNDIHPMGIQLSLKFASGTSSLFGSKNEMDSALSLDDTAHFSDL